MKKNKKEKNVIKIEELNAILDRTIGFVENCDTKASIMLALFGVLLTVICTSNVTDSIIEIIDNVATDISGGDYVYIFSSIIAMIFVAASVVELVLVLTAKIDRSGLDSPIYFKDISENVNCHIYGSKIKMLSEDAYIDDIINQIYVNSQICSKKYERYNLTIKLGAVGTFLFIILYFIGIFLYK